MPCHLVLHIPHTDNATCYSYVQIQPTYNSSPSVHLPGTTPFCASRQPSGLALLSSVGSAGSLSWPSPFHPQLIITKIPVILKPRPVEPYGSVMHADRLGFAAGAWLCNIKTGMACYASFLNRPLAVPDPCCEHFIVRSVRPEAVGSVRFLKIWPKEQSGSGVFGKSFQPLRCASHSARSGRRCGETNFGGNIPGVASASDPWHTALHSAGKATMKHA